MPQRKTCTKCGETKTLDGFRKRNSRNAVESRCKNCEAEYRRRYREENREKILERGRRSYEENREQRLEYARRYHDANREKKRSKARRYHWENREQRLEYSLRWNKENREKVRESQRSRYEENRDVLNHQSRKNIAQLQELSKKLATVPPGTPWLPGEDALVLADNKGTDYQKAIELGRTWASVTSRKQRLRARATTSA